MTSPPAQPPRVALILIHPSSGHRQTSWELAGLPALITIGRGAQNTIVFDRDGVSRRHARLEKRGDELWLLDQGSTNGTFVNDTRVQSVRLRPGDRITIGTMVLSLRDIEEEDRFISYEYKPSLTDGLTGAYNKRHLLAQIKLELERQGSAGRPLTLVMLDLDHFKKINDLHGHLWGDWLLREISSLVLIYAAPEGLVARFGGEEFALLLPGVDREQGAAIAEQLRAEVAAHSFVFEEKTARATLSAGVAQSDGRMRSEDELIRRCDERLYEAKLQGRNRVVT